jgi:hypothetical protein
MKRAIIAAGLSLLSFGAWAPASDDDLAVVKRAVAVSQAAPATPEAATPAVKATKSSRHTEPQWLKVRIVEKANQKARVTINLPLALARALGDEVPVDWHCDSHKCADTLKLSEVLAALKAGQSLVEIDDDEATVRIWVE